MLNRLETQSEKAGGMMEVRKQPRSINTRNKFRAGEPGPFLPSEALIRNLKLIPATLRLYPPI